MNQQATNINYDPKKPISFVLHGEQITIGVEVMELLHLPADALIVTVKPDGKLEP